MMPDPQPKKRVEFPLPPDGYAIEKCRSCGCEVVWTTTAAGKPMPLDWDSVRWAGGDAGFAESHFAYCKQASSWRKPK